MSEKMIGKLEALLIVCSIADKDKEKFGKVMLNKAMFFSELEYYMQTGQRLTDTVYIKDKYGPVVRRLDDYLETMQEQKSIHIRMVDNVTNDGLRAEFTCLKKPFIDLKDQRHKRLKIVTRNLIDNYKAESVSDLSHDRVYNFFDMGEVIDFNIARAIKMECTNEATVEWGRSFPVEWAY